MTVRRSHLATILVSLGLLGSLQPALAETLPPTTSTTTPATATVPTNKLVGEFTGLAGSTENATALVNGLRTGGSITLTDPYAVPPPPGTPAPTTTFSPGTKPMGYGNVRIALSLARVQLANQGITNPTPQQLQGALVGTSGPGGTTQGILEMRASGMGWGQIANSMGVKLGAVMSGKAVGPDASGATASHHGKGVVTAADGAGSASHGKGVVTGDSGAGSVSHGNGKGNGITTAAGAGGGNPHVTTGMGQGGGGSSGAVNASGGKAGGAASGSHGGGNGHGKS